MAEYIVKTLLRKTHGLSDVEIIYVNAPTRDEAPRATSTDNFTSWKRDYGHEGLISRRDYQILLVSNEPYVEYQACVARRVLSDNFSQDVKMISPLNKTHFQIGNWYTIEVVGHKGNPDKLTVELDNLARIVCESLPFWKKQLELVATRDAELRGSPTIVLSFDNTAAAAAAAAAALNPNQTPPGNNNRTVAEFQ